MSSTPSIVPSAASSTCSSTSSCSSTSTSTPASTCSSTLAPTDPGLAPVTTGAASTIPNNASKKDRSWHDMTHEELAKIDQARQAVKAKGEIKRDTKGVYGAICRACTKPNNPDVPCCTGCGFPLSPYDVERLPDNIFLQMVNGEDVGANVVYRSKDFLIFDDKFPVSVNHVCVIPTKVIEDITHLTKDDLPMLYEMYRLGLEELNRRNVPWLKDHKIEDFLSAGYNFPVSVKHLHIHMMIPPYTHEKILQYPRWHSHSKVVGDIEKYGKVHLYKDEPDDAAGEAELTHALNSWKKVNEILQHMNDKDNNNNNNDNASNTSHL